MLGGSNDKYGNLSDFVLKRINTLDKVISDYNVSHSCIKIILSGGTRFSNIPHCIYSEKEVRKKHTDISIDKFIDCNDTIDEALALKKYLDGGEGDVDDVHVTVITSNWHMNRAKYIFNTVFKHRDIDIKYHQTDERNINNIDLVKEEHKKLEHLIAYPYGKWEKIISSL